jgi:hypothetical protein
MAGPSWLYGARIERTLQARPNKRLKLAAPVLTESGARPERRRSRILFVNTSAWRRSLSAIR